MANLMLGIVSFLLALNTALAITCYSCDSSKGGNCNWGFLSFTYSTVDCNAKDENGGFLSAIGSVIPQKCYKLVGVDKQNNEYVSRGCVTSTGPIDSCQYLAEVANFLKPGDLQSLQCSSCNTDKCNSASKFASATIAAVLFASFVFLF
ncbi:uncharacterized protein LOC108738868 [Agrilus planipennis]|uniref:Uncharacterized protein LOC108738868 n=1 Tax=Agrilus planipennis TaxID=224129 RepID=A0A1W4WVT6_AGRPL|nr:uncharacterized protein LOC108738868 [Agrilus planipennis]